MLEKRVAVAVIGAGPAGLGAATGLALRGVGPILVLERRDEPGGIPARYKTKKGGVPTFVLFTRGRVVFGDQFTKILVNEFEKTGAEIRLETQVLSIDPRAKTLTAVSPGEGVFRVKADAIIMASGAREETQAERGTLGGARPARTFYTKNLIDWMDRIGRLPMQRPAIVGSDIIAWSAAAKLASMGAKSVTMLGVDPKPKSGFFESLYFRRWSNPCWRGGIAPETVAGLLATDGVRLANGDLQPADGVVFSGGLVPNSELGFLGGLEGNRRTRKLALTANQALSAPGWFAAGGILGDFHGAQWCNFNGRRIAKQVALYLASL